MKKAFVVLAVLAAGCATTGEADRLDAARAAYEAADYDGCVAECTAALEERSAEPAEAHLWRGKAYERKGELGRAVADYAQSRRQDPARGEAAFRQARCQLALGQLDQAETTIQAVLVGELPARDRMLAHAVYGEVHLAAGNASKAAPEFDAALKVARASRALSSDPAAAVIHYNLSRAHFEAGAYKAAREAYLAYLEGLRRAGALPPGEDLYTLGVLQFLCGDVRAARETGARLPAELKVRMEAVLSGNAFSVRALYDPPAAEGAGNPR